MLVLPFILLIRGSVWLYESYQWWYWLAMLAMFAGVFVLLLIYVVMLYDALVGSNKVTRTGLKAKSFLVVVIMLLFGGYTLFNLSGANTKTEEVRKEFTSLHPFLRLGVGTLVMLDRSLLITDLSRAKEDYKKMGLKSLKNSLHYPQSDGFVHAMDLRTKGRSEVQNFLTQTYFQLMGFNTLRHTGTADHLHISLSIPENPNAL
ncbi:MAG: hypothetical protein AAF206_08540 [Bacteroidota bacterium]